MKHNQFTTAIVSLTVISILAGCGVTQESTSTQRTGASNETINVTNGSTNKAKNPGVTKYHYAPSNRLVIATSSITIPHLDIYDKFKNWLGNGT